MDALLAFLSNTWPMFFALALVGAITYGALTPYIRQERRRRQAQEQHDD
ncbi:hypothetical protein [Tropicibacter naphthalenivorans]|uniref:Uncharacterized protein n=1 Tax=Tropicibacter naphthalenivorans TaxID=441103 RepID=A0A0P1G630_9RHOB|nr:hypothetical protein [Tropicibacter naphthalenivorans]CUH77206.1 hypothetical protein TRN7648_01349 [Tropicibacter naphthalenivorans]SMC59921.1 hypothetical protein SAMN04488093_102269 [Tropicibacter naphthalenivorans]